MYVSSHPDFTPYLFEPILYILDIHIVNKMSKNKAFC